MNKLNQMKKLSIGCGYDKKGDFMNIDIPQEVKPDKIVNIEKGLPFKNNSFDEIYSCHCLEHIQPHYWKFVLEEIEEVVKDGTKFILDLPYDHILSRTTTDHYRTFSFMSFSQYSTKTNGPYYLNNFLLENITKYPPRFVRLFFTLFPFLKRNIHFEFIIRKKK